MDVFDGGGKQREGRKALFIIVWPIAKYLK